MNSIDCAILLRINDSQSSAPLFDTLIGLTNIDSSEFKKDQPVAAAAASSATDELEQQAASSSSSNALLPRLRNQSPKDPDIQSVLFGIENNNQCAVRSMEWLPAEAYDGTLDEELLTYLEQFFAHEPNSAEAFRQALERGVIAMHSFERSRSRDEAQSNQRSIELIMDERLEAELVMMALLLREPVVYQYASERGYLLLSEKSKEKHGIIKANITLYVQDSPCLGQGFVCASERERTHVSRSH